MSQCIEMLKTRRAVRQYKEQKPEMKLLQEVAEVGLYAPSGMGRQSAVVVTVTDKKIRNMLSDLNRRFIPGADSDPFYGAPVVMVVLADKRVPTYLYDGSLMMGNLMNAAHAVGLATCWVHRAKQMFETPEGKELLKKWNLDPENYEGIGNCVIGYSDGPYPQPAPRRAGRALFVTEE